VREALLVVSIMPLAMVIEGASNLMHVVGSQPLPNLKPFFPSFHSPSQLLVSHLFVDAPFFPYHIPLMLVTQAMPLFHNLKKQVTHYLLFLQSF